MKGASLCSAACEITASKRMTSPEKSISQAHLCACVCVCAKKALNKYRPSSSGVTQLNKGCTKTCRQRPPSISLKLSKTCHRWPRIHSLILQDELPWPPNLFNLCSTPDPLSPRWLWGGPSVSDTQSPSVTLTFHSHKDKNDTASLCSLLNSFGCLVCFCKDDGCTNKLLLPFLF